LFSNNTQAESSLTSHVYTKLPCKCARTMSVLFSHLVWNALGFVLYGNLSTAN